VQDGARQSPQISHSALILFERLETLLLDEIQKLH
jgi:hypothetical protein